jgi:hypothetical protein
MSVDWQRLIEKKRRRGKPAPSDTELLEMEQTAADLLRVPAAYRDQIWGDSLGYGARTRSLIAIRPHVPHRFSKRFRQVVAKLFKGPAEDYRRFHQGCFAKLPVLPGNTSFQQSLEAGTWKSHGAYAVLEYVDGKTLREHLESGQPWSGELIRAVLNDLIGSIWIPSWDSGLRFKDCHKGNFVLNLDDYRLTMIDVEQIRKSAFEWLDRPAVWNDRSRHERSALRQLPGLICDVLAMRQTGRPAVRIRRIVVDGLEETKLPESLLALGKEERAMGPRLPDARLAAKRLLQYLQTHDLI